MRARIGLSLVLPFLFAGIGSAEQEVSARTVWKELHHPELIVTAMGGSDAEHTIEAIVHRDDLRYEGEQTRILLIGRGGHQATVIRRALLWFYTSPEAATYRPMYTLAALPTLHVSAAGDDMWRFPPPDDSTEQPAANRMHLWRWIGMQAPDLVVDVDSDTADTMQKWFVPQTDDPVHQRWADTLQPAEEGRADELAAALTRHAPCETGTIPAVRVSVSSGHAEEFLPQLLAAVQASGFREPSAARRELQIRTSRTPVEVARQLSQHYGHDLQQVVYIPAVALIGRLRLGELTGEPGQLIDVQQIVAPYFPQEVDTTPTSGSGQSGHLVFTQLARRTTGTTQARYLALARHAADLAFRGETQSSGLMPDHHEMSDALFMGGPILAEVGQLTGDPRYYDACMRHLRAMRRLVLRTDGLYRHSPLDEAAWGRGNGFPALGLAWCLTYWPEDRKDHAELLEMFRRQVIALLEHQDEQGCWHQVIDHPQTYRELSATCMITFALARGVQRHWLDAQTCAPAIDRAWYAIRARVSSQGQLVDVCTGTGKQETLRDYYQRRAILGMDPRGGAMALLVATELADL